jgi:ribosome maturation factor RimP
VGCGLLSPFFILTGSELQNLNAMIEKIVTQLGYELVDFEMQNRGRLLRVFIDKADGIDIDDCVLVSNQIGNVLAVEHDIDYDRLEVSSPGLDRVLKKLTDFERFKGFKATIKLRLALDGRKNFVGSIADVAEDCVHLNVDGETVSFTLQQIEKARLVPEY